MLKELTIFIGILALCLNHIDGRTLATEITTMIVETTEASIEESTTLATLATSRDEESSILIDPASGTLQDQDKLQQKSAKLLLLSAPPKRPVEIEQQFEEEDEAQDNPTAAAAAAAAASAATATNDELTTTTTEASPEDTTHEDNVYATTTTTTTATATATATAAAAATTTTTPATTTEAITKLFAINATVASENAPPPNVAVALAMDNSTVSIAEQPQEAGNNNAAIELALVEPEAEYVLVADNNVHDNDVLVANDDHHHELAEFGELQLGSFTHIDSDVHLQPVVHSVEIVPTSFDDPLIVNYVHNLR